jgi:hypothetical protein
MLLVRWSADKPLRENGPSHPNTGEAFSSLVRVALLILHNGTLVDGKLPGMTPRWLGLTPSPRRFRLRMT